MSSVTPAIFTLVKSRWEKICFVIHDYGRHRIADIRVWERREGSRGFLPSKKGICFPLHRLPAFLEGLEMLAKTAEASLPQASAPCGLQAGEVLSPQR